MGACSCAAPEVAASGARAPEAASHRTPLAPSPRRLAPYGVGLSFALAAVVPKCPMCLAAYLAVLGVGSELAASAHPLLRPLSVALILLALATWLVPKLRRRPSPSA